MDDKSKNPSKNSQTAKGSSALPAEDTSLESTPPNPPEADLSESLNSFSSSTNRPPKRGFSLGHLLDRLNRYLLILGVLVLVIVAAVVLSLKFNSNSSKNPKAASLTDQQLSELKGSTTVVGDSQQVLDVQSNSVFEGQVLVRSNLDVAGSIKVGGPLSLSSVTVGGSSSFG